MRSTLSRIPLTDTHQIIAANLLKVARCVLAYFRLPIVRAQNL